MATDRRVNVKVDVDVSGFNRGILSAAATLKTLDKSIDQSNDRTAWLAQSVLGLGPAFVPIGAAAVPIIAGLSAELLAAGTAAGIAVFAFQGVGDGLKALNDYQVKPTAENLAKLNEAFAKLGPDGEHFVRFLDKVGSQLSPLQNIGRGGIFPGVEEGITSLMTLLPQATRIVRDMAEAMGEISADAGANLAGPKFTAFFDYLEREGRPILESTARTAGNFVDGIAAMVVAFEPLTGQFVGGFEKMSKSFAEWAHGLEDSDSFASFLQYIEDNGPRVEELFEAMGRAIVSILEAAAPVGAVLVPAFTQLLDVISAIAQTPLGPLLVGLGSLLGLWGRLRALQSITTGGAFGTLFGGTLTEIKAAPAALNAATTSTRGLASAQQAIVNTQRAATTANREYLASLRATSSLMAVAPGAARETGISRTSAAAENVVNASKAQEHAARGAAAAEKERAEALGTTRGAALKAGAAIAGMTVLTSGLADKIGLSNTAMGAMIGTMVEPGLGTAIGAVAGGVLDVTAAVGRAKDAEDAWAAALRNRSTAQLQAARSQLEDARATAGKKTPAAQLVSAGAGYGAARQPDTTFATIDQRKLAAINKELEMRGARVGAASLSLIADHSHLTASGLQSASASADQMNRSLERLGQTLTGRASMRDYQAAIDDVRASMKENGHTLDINTAKGRANQASLDAIASTAVNVAKGMQGIDRIKFLDSARGDLIRAARQFGLTRREANALANRLLGMDKIRVNPSIDVQKQRAEAKIKDAKARLKELDGMRPSPKVNAEIEALKRKVREAQAALASLRDQDVTITTHLITVGNKPKAPSPGAGGNADGGPVYGPGGPKDDMVPRWLSNGEFVVNAKAYQQFRNEIEWMNAQGLANGGRVGTPSVSVGSPRIDLRGMQVVATFDGIGTLVGRIARIEANEAIADHQEMVLTTAGATY